VLFFAEGEATLTVPESRVVQTQSSNPTPQEIARLAFEELIKGPSRKAELVPTIPPKTRLLSVSLSGDLLTVDFSRELVSYGGGATYEINLLNSILTTAAFIPNVRRVQILIDGARRDYLPEGLPIGEPLEAQFFPNRLTPSEDRLAVVWLRLRQVGMVPVTISLGERWVENLSSFLRQPQGVGIAGLSGAPHLLEVVVEPMTPAPPKGLDVTSPPVFEQVTIELAEGFLDLPSDQQEVELAQVVATFGARRYRVSVGGREREELSVLADRLRLTARWLF